MKKFVKYGLIGGCVLGLAGVGLVTASVALGADMQRIIRYLDHHRHLGGSALGSSVIRYPQDSYVDVDKNGIRIKAGDGELELDQDGVRLKDGDGELELDRSGVRLKDEDGELELGRNGIQRRAGDGQIRDDGDGAFFKTENSWVSPLEDGNFEAGYKAVTSLEVKVSGGTVGLFSLDEIEELTIKSEKGTLDHVEYREFAQEQKLSLTAYDGEDYQLFIPSSWELEELEVDVLQGDFSGENIRAYDAEYETRGGDLLVSQIGGSTLELKVTGGAMSWTAVKEMPRLVEADCQNGDLTIELPEGMDADGIGYEMECENGLIEIPGFTAEGTMEKKISGKSGMTRMELETENVIITVIQ